MTRPAVPPPKPFLPGLSVTHGRVAPSLGNIVMLLTSDPDWVGCLRWSDFDDAVRIDGCVLSRSAVTQAALWMDRAYTVMASDTAMLRAMACVAREHPVRPVAERLAGYRWDGVERAPGLLHRYFGAEDTPLHAELGRAFLVGCVARALDPGCVLDTMLVLVGRNGSAISSALAALVPEASWFGAFRVGPLARDPGRQLTGIWIGAVFDVGAVDGDDEVLREILATRVDRPRGRPGPFSVSRPRHAVLVGLCASIELLADPSSSAHLWPADVGAPNMPAIFADHEQIWAEAVHRYHTGEPWDLRGPFPALLAEAQAGYQRHDPLGRKLAGWAARQPGMFTTEAALIGALGRKGKVSSRGNRERVQALLIQLGYSYKRPRAGEGRRPRGWVRLEDGGGVVQLVHHGDERWTTDSQVEP